jgi:hypothetical protein
MTERYKNLSCLWRYDENVDLNALYLETIKFKDLGDFLTR